MEYYFYQLAYWDSKFHKRYVGLNQMQCSPSFDWNWGKKKMTPLHVGTSYTHDFGFYSKRTASGTQIVWAVRGEGAQPPSNPYWLEDTPFKIPPVLII